MKNDVEVIWGETGSCKENEFSEVKKSKSVLFLEICQIKLLHSISGKKSQGKRKLPKAMAGLGEVTADFF